MTARRLLADLDAPRGQSQRGVALAIVVWFIAGMSLLVSGIASEAKIDTRMAQVHYFRAQAAAAGDGAIKLALAEQYGQRESGQAGIERQLYFRVGSHDVEIRMIPAGLFVNISNEDQRGLRALFAERVGASRFGPDQLAAAVVRYRDGSQGRRGRPFHSPEDLLRVPGIDRGVYDAVRDFIVVGELSEGFSGQPKPVPARLRMIEAAMRGQGAMLQGPVQHAADSVRVDAVVRLGGQEWVRRRWITLDAGAYSALPWRSARVEAARPLVFED